MDRTAGPDDVVTQFEALTAAAYHELARQEVEVAVVEAGLGGRYDATNVIPSRVQVLTGIDLEHTRWLGPAHRGHRGGEARGGEGRRDAGGAAGPRSGRRRRGRARGARSAARGWCSLRRPTTPASTCAPPGGFQRANFALAAAAAEAFLGRALDPAAVAAAGRETRVAGRMDVVGQDPLTIYDGAHNPSGADALAASLDDVLDGRRPRVAVIGVLEDKDAAAMLRALLPRFERVVFTRSGEPARALARHAGEPGREARAGRCPPRPPPTRARPWSAPAPWPGPAARCSRPDRST